MTVSGLQRRLQVRTTERDARPNGLVMQGGDRVLWRHDYRAKLAKAGFEEIDVEPTRIYTAESAREFLAGAGLGAEAIGDRHHRRQVHERIREARKPLV